MQFSISYLPLHRPPSADGIQQAEFHRNDHLAESARAASLQAIGALVRVPAEVRRSLSLSISPKFNEVLKIVFEMKESNPFERTGKKKYMNVTFSQDFLACV